MSGINDEAMTVVFAQYEGLDFNGTLSVASGELLKIVEAR